MRQTIFTILLLSVIGFTSCKKKQVYPDIEQYDLSQIQGYIATNHITGMVRDTSGGDTTGMYYKILTPGDPSMRLADTSLLSFVFTVKSFDGQYTNTDTIQNHFYNYLGELTNDAWPSGLQIALLNDLRYNGGSMRILIPSRMAYGLYGYGTGSIETINSHIAGNQCLDYYVHTIINQPAYDNLVIQNYIKQNNLTGYNYVSSGTYAGLYYKIAVQGIGTDTITQNSTITTTREGRLLDDTIFDEAYNSIADTLTVDVPNLLIGEQGALIHATNDATVSMLIPSVLAYGITGSTGVPKQAPIRYEYEIRGVKP